jgi:sulfur carrier protein ThiS
MPKAKTITVKLALLSEEVKTFKIKAGTKIADFLSEHNIEPKGNILVNGEKASKTTVIKEDSTILIVPKVEGA